MTIYYKLHHLSNDNSVKKIYAFVGNDDPDKIDGLLEDYEKDDMSNVVYVKQLIYPDDSIDMIKRKLIKNITVDITYPEIHMFCIKNTIITYRDFMEKLFKKKSKQQISHIKTIRSNLVDDGAKNGFSLLNDNSVDYSSIATVDFTEPLVRYMSLDKRFSGNNELMDFVSNPFSIEGNSVFLTSDMRKGNHLSLLNYGEIKDNVIYFCDVESVITGMENIPSKDIIYYYFPILNEIGINNLDELKSSRKEISKKYMSKKMDSYMSIIDNYYSHYERNKNSLYNNLFSKTGISKIEIEIINVTGTTIPFDIIFKNVHATKKYPIVKTTVNKNAERFVRFYSEEENKNGDKIPYLESGEIIRVLKTIPNIRGVYVYMPVKQEDDISGYLIIGIKDSGNIFVRCSFENMIEKSVCEKLIETSLEDLMDSLKVHFIKVGYDPVTFTDFDNDSVKITKMDYVFTSPVKKGKVSKLKNCMTEIFEYNQKDKSDQKSKKEHIFDFKKHKHSQNDIDTKINVETKLDNLVITVQNIETFGWNDKIKYNSSLI